MSFSLITLALAAAQPAEPSVPDVESPDADAANAADEVDTIGSDDDEIVVEEDRIVCKRIKPPTASRISRSKKVCQTESEWEAERQAASDLSSDYLRDEAIRSRHSTSNMMNDSRTGPN